MAMITETEELDVSSAARIRGSTEAWLETVEKTMEDVVEASLSRKRGEPLGETVEEAAGETVEESVGKGKKSHKGRAKNPFHSYNPQAMFQVATQKSHLEKMCEWLLPYIIAVVLVISIGGAVILVSHFRTQQLNRQLLEQYGEYFTDG